MKGLRAGPCCALSPCTPLLAALLTVLTFLMFILLARKGHEVETHLKNTVYILIRLSLEEISILKLEELFVW